MFLGGVDGGLDGLSVGHVAEHPDRFAARRLDGGHRGGGVGHVGHNHRRTLGCKAFRPNPAQAGGGAGDQRHLAVQTSGRPIAPGGRLDVGVGHMAARDAGAV